MLPSFREVCIMLARAPAETISVLQLRVDCCTRVQHPCPVNPNSVRFGITDSYMSEGGFANTGLLSHASRLDWCSPTEHMHGTVTSPVLAFRCNYGNVRRFCLPGLQCSAENSDFMHLSFKTYWLLRYASCQFRAFVLLLPCSRLSL